MSQHYLLPCSCGRTIPVSPAQAGGMVACACGRSLPVPTLRGLRQLEVAAEPAPIKTAGWSRTQGALFAGGLTVAAIGVVLLMMYGLQYGQIMGFRLTADRTQDVLRAQQTEIQKLSPAQVLAEWRKDVEEGLGEQEEPPWSKYKRLAASNLLWIKLAAAAVIGGVLVSLITLATAAVPAKTGR